MRGFKTQSPNVLSHTQFQELTSLRSNRAGYTVSVGDFELDLLPHSFSSVLRPNTRIAFRVDVRVNHPGYAVFKGKLATQSAEWRQGLPRLGAKSGENLMHAEFGLSADGIEESEHFYSEERFLHRMRQGADLLSDPKEFCKACWTDQGLPGCLAQIDNWYSLFWLSVSLGTPPKQVQQRFLDCFATHILAASVRALSEPDLERLAACAQSES